MFRARHLRDDGLFDHYLNEHQSEPVDPPVADHLADCARCRTRYAELRRFMDGLRTEADADLDDVFSPEQLRAQQHQIARRIAHLGQHARVISFPGHPPGRQPAGGRIAPRWLGAAAAAGLLVGVAAGSFFYPSAPAGEPTRARVAGSIASGLPAAAPGRAETGNDLEFLSELEYVLERPHTRELVALDALTPHVREIQYLLR